MEVTLPAVLNGQITPGAADRFWFQARKGQSLVVAASAREIIPYLADAVPGWFQATLGLYDANGVELAYDDDFRFHPDPVLHYVVPKEGSYCVEIKDAIYRGREDFVYRITIGEVPFVTSVFPLGGRAGEQTSIEFRGWNLPVAGLTQDDKEREPGLYRVSVRKEGAGFSEAPFAVDSLPECLEQAPDDPKKGPQHVALPILINGRINPSGNWDVFRFEGRKGDPFVAEVYARRLDSPLDSSLRLTDAAGRQIAFNDDKEDKGSGLATHHADSWLMATLPATGSYDVHIGDAQHKGGLEYGYRLRISAPRPDFELRVVPSTINLRAGGSTLLTVYALRKDGFSGPIPLTLNDPPTGFVLTGARVPANQDRIRITLTAPTKPLPDPCTFVLQGSAVIDGHTITRTAVAAEDMMQAFAYRHLVCYQDLKVAMAEGQGFRAPAQIVGPDPLKIPIGGTARLRLRTPSRQFLDRWQLELNDPPAGITLQETVATPQGAELVFRSDPNKAKPGLAGNLIVDLLPVPQPQAPAKPPVAQPTSAAAGQPAAQPGSQPAAAPSRTQPPTQPPAQPKPVPALNRKRTAAGTLPAIPFEVVEK